MSAALEYVSPGNWETVQTNFDKISANLRQPMPQTRVFNSVALPTANNVPLILTFDSERYDNGAIHSLAANTGRLTAPITGLYSMGANIQWASNAVAYRQIALLLNGLTNIALESVQAATGQHTFMNISAEYHLTAGDYVEVQVQQGSGGALNIAAGGNFSPEFWMHRIGGYTNEGIAV